MWAAPRTALRIWAGIGQPGAALGGSCAAHPSTTRTSPWPALLPAYACKASPRGNFYLGPASIGPTRGMTVTYSAVTVGSPMQTAGILQTHVCYPTENAAIRYDCVGGCKTRSCSRNIHVRGGSDAAAVRRLLRPTPCRPPRHTTPAGGRPVGGRIAQRARPVLLPPFLRRSPATPTIVFMTRSSSSDLLLLIARLLLAVRSIVSRSLMLEVFCHRVLRLCHAAAQGAVAQQQSSELATPALSSWPCLSYSMLMDGVGPVADHCTIIN